jgi:hypothetical protein
MNKSVLKAWDERSNGIRLRLAEMDMDYEYKDLVKLTVETLFPYEGYYADPLFEMDCDVVYPNKDMIHEIDDGDYQGTLLFLIPVAGYQPEDYYYIKVDYGSCSGCDTLLGITGYQEGKPNSQQLQDLFMLCLHIAQRMKLLGESDENNK